MRTATREDRRYLLYNPLVKARATSEGEKVLTDLWDVIAAKGVEKDTFFEAAARDIRLGEPRLRPQGQYEMNP
jgi:acyl-CoA dehydrogenase